MYDWLSVSYCSTQKLGFKRVLLFTNNANPHGNNDQLRVGTFYSHVKEILIDLSELGVRSLANASRARQFSPLNPPGVGWVPLPQTNMAAVVGRACVVGHAWSCVVGRAWSVVRGRSCVVGHAWPCVVVHGRAPSVVRGRAWSCAVVRGRARSCVVVRGRACVVGHSWSCAVGRARSYVVVPFCPLRGQHCRGTNERTTSNNPLNPPGVGWVNFFCLRWEYLSAHACQIWARSDGRVENFVFQIYK